MRGRRVLFLNNQGLDQSGGGVTLLRHLCAHFARDNDVIVVAQSRLPIELEGIEQRVVEPPTEARGPLWRFEPWRRSRHWERVLRGTLPAADVLINLDCHIASAAAEVRAEARIYLSLSAIPRMEWFLGGRAGRAWRFAQYFWLERRAVKSADACLVSSALQREEMRKFELLSDFDPVVLPPAVPALERPAVLDGAEASVPPQVDPGEVVILSVARLEPLKGLELVPELAKRLADLPCTFWVLGEGPERPRLEQMARELGVSDCVTFFGDVRDPSPFLRRADLFFHPSRYESFGMAVFEAMQHGVPPICGMPKANTVVATPEFLEDRREGRLVDLDRPEDVAQALRDWIEAPARRRAVGRAARERARGMLERDYAEGVERLADGLLRDSGEGH